MFNNVGRLTDDSELNGVTSEEMQGIAMSDKGLYWISRKEIARVPPGNKAGGPSDWKVAMPVNFAALGYDHFGDGDVYRDRLYVPVTGESKGSFADKNALVLVYDLDLNLKAFGFLPENQGSVAWVPINPMDGLLYTSKPFQTLQVYDPAKYQPTSEAESYLSLAIRFAAASLEHVGEIALSFRVPYPYSCPTVFGDICASALWIQGGSFSPNGVLYYALDNGYENDSDRTGVHAFRLTPDPKATGKLRYKGTSEIFLKGDEGYGFMRIGYDPTFDVGVTISGDKELEGVVAYRGVDGVIHVLLEMLSSEADDDDVTTFEWTVNEP